MKPEVKVGQVWRDRDRRLPEPRYVRIDRIDTKEEVQTVLGLTRKVPVPIARISSRTETATEFRPVTRFIRCDRLARFYRLIKDVT